MALWPRPTLHRSADTGMWPTATLLVLVRTSTEIELARRFRNAQLGSASAAHTARLPREVLSLKRARRRLSDVYHCGSQSSSIARGVEERTWGPNNVANPLAHNDELGVAVIDNRGEAEAIREEWDELAVAAGRPYCSPAWMLPWWTWMRTGNAQLRTIVFHDRVGVVAIAPFFAQIGKLGLTEYRLLGAGTSHRIGVLCRPGHEVAVAAPLGDALRRLDPRPSSIVWEGIDSRDKWPERTTKALAGRAGVKLRRDGEMGAPTLHLEGASFEEWLTSKSRNFRHDLLKKRRRFEAEGGSIRRTRSETELEADLAAFARLHRARWAARGGSGFFDDRIVAMLRDVGSELLDADRFRLYMVELKGIPIAASVCVAAGDAVAWWATGMDDAHGRLSPTLLGFLRAVEESCERGEGLIDLGGGAAGYKQRFANRNEPIIGMTQFPRGRRYPLTRAQLFPKHVRYHLRSMARRLPPECQQQLKRILRRR